MNLEDCNNDVKEVILTKLKHPELKIASEYYFDYFREISGELYIIGLSPNNDDHILNIIKNNDKITKVIFYCHSDDEYKAVENIMDFRFKPEKVNDLWQELGECTYINNYNYNIPSQIDAIIEDINTLSGCSASKKRIIDEINSISQYKMDELCGMVKAEMIKKNLYNIPTTEEEFQRNFYFLSHLATRNGILPPSLLLLCIMNIELLK